MGLGPLNSSILPRVAVEPLSDRTAQELEDWMRNKQIERSTARALGALKRREKASKVKVPKPRRHKHHCYCSEPTPVETIPGLAPTRGALDCCRCKGGKCLKPKKPKKVKEIGPTNIEPDSSAICTTA